MVKGNLNSDELEPNEYKKKSKDEGEEREEKRT